ncbi:hypothetical protein [Dickeya undicola]|nr:hypothetical protein [Dickeya undicola]
MKTFRLFNPVLLFLNKAKFRCIPSINLPLSPSPGTMSLAALAARWQRRVMHSAGMKHRYIPVILQVADALFKTHNVCPATRIILGIDIKGMKNPG